MKLYCSHCSKTFEYSGTSEEKTVCPLCQQEIAVPAEPIAPGVVVGDFLIEKLISKGGMGEVFLARQLSLDRSVALKVLQSKYTGDKEYVDSLYREARAAAKINHPNIVQAYAVGEENGIFYFAMEYVRGETFKEILKREGKLDFAKAAKVICDIARALDAAWREQKLVHQDIKPDNIMLDANGFAKLADLGLAKTASSGQEKDENATEVLGTPQYISPEQLTGVPTDVRSDIYSLGATFFQFVTGRFPYVAPTVDEIAKMHVAGQLEPPKQFNPELPEELNTIIVKMMARYPEERYQTPEPLIKALEMYLLHAAEKESSVPKVARSLSGLKINGGAAAPKLKPLPSAVPKPAPKPTVPAAPKPAVPAAPKPVVPAAPKPVVPAAPKPVVPAAPKPAVPAAPKPVVPAAPKPAVPAAPKPETPAAPEKAAPAKAEENAKPENEPVSSAPRRKNIIRWSVIGVLILIVLLLGGAVTLTVLEAKGKNPAILQPVGAELYGLWQKELNRAKEKAIALAQPTQEAESAGEMTVVVSARPEYLAAAAELMEWYLANQTDGSGFLKKMDSLWPQISLPCHQEEREQLEKIIPVFAGIDEQFRSVSEREAMRTAHRARIAEIVRQREDAEREKKEAKAKLEEQQRENERLLREQAAKHQSELKAQAQRLAALKKQLEEFRYQLSASALACGVRDDRTAWDQCGEKIDRWIKLYLPETFAEKSELQKFAEYRKQFSPLMEGIGRVRQMFARVRESNSIRLFMPKHRILVVCEIAPDGVLRCVDGKREQFKLTIKDLPLSVRRSFYRDLTRRKVPNAGFYFGLISGEVGKTELESMPGGFWKSNWKYFEPTLRRP